MKVRFFIEDFGGKGGPPEPSCQVVGLEGPYLLALLLRSVLAHEGTSPSLEVSWRRALRFRREFLLLLAAACDPQFYREDYCPDPYFFSRELTQRGLRLVGEEEYHGPDPSGRPWTSELSLRDYAIILVYWWEFLGGGLGEEFILDLEHLEPDYRWTVEEDLDSLQDPPA